MIPYAAFVNTGVSSGTPGSGVTVDETKTYTLIDTLSESTYYLSTCLDQSPLDENILLQVFTRWSSAGHKFSENSTIGFRKSTDKGLTWGTPGTAYNPAGNLGIIDMGGGFGPNNKWHGFADQHLGDGSGNNISTTPTLIYFTTSDYGDNWTITDISSILPGDDKTVMRTYGNLIANNGVLMSSMYMTKSDFTSTSIYLIRSTDDGATRSLVNVYTGTTYINEGTMINLGDDELLLIARNESTKEWNQFRSSDNGLTWTNQGNLSLGESFSAASPGKLVKFLIEDTPVIAFYYPNRGSNPRLLKVVYAKASDIIASGIAGWNLSTKTIINNSSTYWHYGDVCHYNNNFNAIGSYAKEGGTAFVANSLLTFHMPSTHYLTVKTALGI
jgi:hypothetical protein